MLYGDFQFLQESKNVLAFSRSYFGEKVWIILNKNSEAYTFAEEKPEGMQEKIIFGNTKKTNTKAFSIEIPANAFAIIQWNKI